MSTRDALVAVADLLAPGEPEVADRVVLAHDDPERYLVAQAERLDERGIDEPLPELAWIALVDALTDHGFLAEVDWKEGSEEIVAQLKELRSAPDGAWDWESDPELATYDFLVFAGDRLRGAGTALAALDIESDCYPLVLLPADEAATLVELAAQAGFKADVYAS